MSLTSSVNDNLCNFLAVHRTEWLVINYSLLLDEYWVTSLQQLLKLLVAVDIWTDHKQNILFLLDAFDKRFEIKLWSFNEFLARVQEVNDEGTNLLHELIGMETSNDAQAN